MGGFAQKSTPKFLLPSPVEFLLGGQELVLAQVCCKVGSAVLCPSAMSREHLCQRCIKHHEAVVASGRQSFYVRFVCVFSPLHTTLLQLDGSRWSHACAACVIDSLAEPGTVRPSWKK